MAPKIMNAGSFVAEEQALSNKGLELTASSVRCAPASGSSSGLALVRQAKLGVSCEVKALTG